MHDLISWKARCAYVMTITTITLEKSNINEILHSNYRSCNDDEKVGIYCNNRNEGNIKRIPIGKISI